jgi:hypothetical protein
MFTALVLGIGCGAVFSCALATCCLDRGRSVSLSFFDGCVDVVAASESVAESRAVNSARALRWTDGRGFENVGTLISEVVRVCGAHDGVLPTVYFAVTGRWAIRQRDTVLDGGVAACTTSSPRFV